MNSRKYAAFTLIELLVVIAIIAILAAILFPVFAQAREKARQAACLSNEKQIGTAVLQYQQDYDELYPSVDLEIPTSASPVMPILPLPDGRKYQGQMVWPLQLFPYIKSKEVFVCPNDDLAGATNYDNGTAQWANRYGKPINLSYGINESMAFFGSTTGAGYTNTAPVSLADVPFPASTYYVGDVNPWQSPTFGQGNQDPTKSSTFNRVRFAKPCGGLQTPADGKNGGTITILSNSGTADACTRHTGGGTMVFADGHAKWMKWSQLLATQVKYNRTTD